MDSEAVTKKKKKSKKKKKTTTSTTAEDDAAAPVEKAVEEVAASVPKKKKKKKKKVESGEATSTSDEAASHAPKEKKKKKKKTAAPSDQLALHKAVYKGDLAQVSELLQQDYFIEHIDERDHRGNTALHIAGHFCKMDIIEALLEAGANAEEMSAAGWRPLEEAIATGSMEAASALMIAGHTRYRQDMLSKGPEWIAKLKEMDDFYLELHWDFSVLGGWLPLVSNFCPNDVYRVWKRGASLRLDYTLVGFKNFQMTRGDVSFIFTGEDAEPNGHLFVLNREKKTKQDFCEEPGEHYMQDVSSALNYLFAHDICSHLPLSVDDENHDVEFKHRTGWFSSSATKETVHGYHTIPYDTHGMQFRSLIRSDPDAKQTRIPRSIQDASLFEDHQSKFDEYFNQDVRDPFSVTEKPDGLTWETENVKRKLKKFEGSLWIAQDFPLSMPDFLTLIEVYSPTSQALKMLQEFITMKMPEGFPVKIQLPLYYLLSATVQFRNFEYKTPDASLFEIPEDFELVQEAYIGSEAREMFKTVEAKGSQPNVAEDK